MITYLDVQDSGGNAVRLHRTNGRRLSGAQGLPGVLGFAGARDATYPRPSYHGNVTRSRWQKAGLVTLEGLVIGATPDATIAEYDALVLPLLDALDTPRLMTWQRGTDGTGVELQAYARLVDDVAVKDDAGGRLLRYQATFRLDDPRGYTQSLLTSTGGTLATSGGDIFPDTFPDTFDPASGGTAPVNNIGTRPTPPIIRAYGYATSAQIVLVETGERIALTGVIAPGDYLEIDVAQRTVKLNGTSSAQGQVDSAATTWFELPRGTSTVQMFAGANDSVTRCDVLYRPAYA